MLTFLVRTFIKDYKNTSSPIVREAYGVLSGTVGISLNLLLFAGKFFAGLLSHSIAITADAFNNLSDAGSSLITLIGFKMAGQKPDSDHPFGHGRIEYLSGLLVSLAILLMAVELIKTSFHKIIQPEAISFQPIILVILFVSILIKCYMAYYNRILGKRIESSAMKAISIDSLSDTLATLVVLIATLLSHYTGLLVDGYCGVLVGLFILYAGFNAARDTINPLLGQPASKECVDTIKKIISSHTEILGIHDLIVHDYGPGRLMITLHAEVPANGDILTLHDVIDTVEQEMNDALNCETTIHMDPIVHDDPLTLKLRREITSIVTDIDPTFTIHDFRIITGPTHTNLIFDMVVPPNNQINEAQIKTAIHMAVQNLNPTYFEVIKIDHSYV